MKGESSFKGGKEFRVFGLLLQITSGNKVGNNLHYDIFVVAKFNWQGKPSPYD